MSASFITWAADLQPFEKKKKNSPTLLMIICDLEKGEKLSLKKKKLVSVIERIVTVPV